MQTLAPTLALVDNPVRRWVESLSRGVPVNESVCPPEGGERAGPHSDLYVDLYEELHERARRWKRRQPWSATLQTTGLVHDACLKLLVRDDVADLDRTHALALAATAMRHVLVDRARARGRVKRSAPGERVPLGDIAIAYEDRAVDLLALNEAMERLAEFDPQMSKAVELRFFGGLSVADSARCLGLSKRTFERRWETTRDWLRAELR